MSKLAGLTGVQGGVIAGAAAVVIAGGATWYSGVFSPQSQPEPQKVALLPQGAGEPGAEETGETPKPTPEPKPEPVANDPVAKDPEPEAQPEVVAQVAMQPEFDLVRVEPDGNATIAGRADPGVEIVIELDGQDVSRAQASGDGSFVQFLEIAPSTEPQLVRLKVEPENGDAVYSATSAVIAPMVQVAAAEPEPVEQASEPVQVPEPKQEAVTPEVETASTDTLPTQADSAPASSQPEPTEPEAASAEPQVEPVKTAEAAPQPVEPAKTEAEVEEVTVAMAPEAVVAVTAEIAPEPAAEPVLVASVEPEPAKPAQPVAPAVIIAGQDGVKVVQPLASAPEVMSAVALDTISYSDQGEVLLAGRGQGSGFVRVYVDNRPVTTSRIEADGNWRSDLPDVDTGIYTLRVDEIDTEGQVVSRVETPFKREAQEVVVEAGQVKAITVQPGNTLWAIAQDNYGEGNLYVRLFEANKDRIRNPDLIYPGQVFDIPGE